MAQSVRSTRRRRISLRSQRNVEFTRNAQTFLSMTIDCHLCKTTGQIGKGLGSFITGDTIPCTNCGGTGYVWVTKDWVKWTIALTVGIVLLALLIAMMKAGVVEPFGSGAMLIPATHARVVAVLAEAVL